MATLDELLRIADVFDRLQVPWVLGGSLASSLVGEPRSTLDIDVAVRLSESQVSGLLDAVEDDYYVSEVAVHGAIEQHGSFNLVHLASATKIDIFVLGPDPLDVRQMDRRERVEIAPGRSVWVGAADDQVLRKLWWFRLGGEVSERQWRDVVTILEVQGSRLDHGSLLDVARSVGLADLVERAIADAEAMDNG